jgi:hypothetical protein
MSHQDVLPLANRREKAPIRALVFGQNSQTAMFAEQPAERFGRISVLKIHADAFAALQRDFLTCDSGGKVAACAERARDQV